MKYSIFYPIYPCVYMGYSFLYQLDIKILEIFKMCLIPRKERESDLSKTVSERMREAGEKKMWSTINNFLVTVDDLVWGVPLMVLIMAGGILLTARLGILQIRKLPLALKWMVRNEEEGEGEISSFGALCTALSATIGTGNIVGVATAVCAGGPGALFWMILAAFFGMATKYSEGLLAVKYRVVAEDGHSLGGPFYYIEQGMGAKWKWLAKLFAFFGVCVGLFGIGTFSQVNGIASAVQGFFDPDNVHMVKILPFLGEYSWAVVIASLVLAFCVAAVLIGGVKRIASVSQIVVPFMAIIYVLFAGGLVICNISEVPTAFKVIVEAAFNPVAITGGVVGSMVVAMQKGVARGIFSNEAGLGTGSIAHACADTRKPVKQGMFGIFEVFTDTIVICTLTALVILCSQVPVAYGEAAGAELTIQGFTAVYGNWVSVFTAVAMCCFAFSTTIGWGLYGARCIEFLFSEKVIRPFMVVYSLVAILGATANLGLMWSIAETFNGLMAIPNLIALFLLAGTVVKLTREYFAGNDQ